MSKQRLVEHYLSIQQYEQARQAVLDCLADEPEQPRMHYLYAYCCLHLDRKREVEEHLVEAIRLGYDAGECQVVFGDLYRGAKRYPLAIRSYEAALRLNPQDSWAQAALAYTYILYGQKSKGEKLLAVAKQADPNDPDVLKFSYMATLERFRMRGEKQAFQEYIEQASLDEKETLTFLGMHALSHKRYKAAREHYRQAFLLDPTDRDVKQTLDMVNLLCQWWMAPKRWAERIGGWLVLYLILLAVFVATLAFNWETLGVSIMFLFVLLVAYSWLVRAMVSYMKSRD